MFKIPSRQYDPNDTEKNVIIQAKLRQFKNESEKFDVLFETVSIYSEVEKLAAAQLNPEEFIQFK